MTKKRSLAIALCAAVVCATSISLASADFVFTLFAAGDPIQDKFTEVNFTSLGNQFGGAFFWLPTKESLPNITLTLGADARQCAKQVRGLYFSNAHGDRILPLDQDSLSGLAAIDSSYNQLTMAGGFYTSCTGMAGGGSATGQDIYSIYGQIKYNRSGSTTWELQAGRKYDYATNAVLAGMPMVPSLQYFNNQTPLGYMYDSVAGLGFIGGDMTSGQNEDVLADLNSGTAINDIFQFTNGSTDVLNAHTSAGDFTFTGTLNPGINTLWHIALLGNVLLSKGGLTSSDRTSILGNPDQQSSIVVSDKMNISTIINQLKSNSASLCRGRTTYDTTVALGSVGDSVVCINTPQDTFTPTGPLIIDLSNTSSYQGKDIIVYDRNVILSGSVDPSSSANINLFVDNGNVMLATTPDQIFDADGNIATSGTGVAGAYIRGNIFVDGLVLGTAMTNFVVPNKLYINGTLATLNTGLEPAQSRKDQISSMFNTLASPTYGDDLGTDYCNGSDCINLNTVFGWECNLDGVGTDGTNCALPDDKFKFNPMVLINTNYPTQLLQ